MYMVIGEPSSREAASSKKAERISIKDAIKVITGNDQLKVFIGVVLCYNLVVQLEEIATLFIFPVISRFLSKKQVFAIASFLPDASGKDSIRSIGMVNRYIREQGRPPEASFALRRLWNIQRLPRKTVIPCKLVVRGSVIDKK